MKHPIKLILRKSGALVQQRTGQNRHAGVCRQICRGRELVSQHDLGEFLTSECAFGQQGTGQASA